MSKNNPEQKLHFEPDDRPYDFAAIPEEDKWKPNPDLMGIPPTEKIEIDIEHYRKPEINQN